MILPFGVWFSDFRERWNGGSDDPYYFRKSRYRQVDNGVKEIS